MNYQTTQSSDEPENPLLGMPSPQQVKQTQRFLVQRRREAEDLAMERRLQADTDDLAAYNDFTREVTSRQRRFGV